MTRGVLFVCMGATLWGTISFFVKNLYNAGFTPMEVVTIRVALAAIILFIFTFSSNRKNIILHRWMDLKYFIGTGIFSISFFNYCMFKTMQLSTVQISAALLYTGPAFVLIISYFVLQEAFTVPKLTSLIFTSVGVILIVGIFSTGQETIPFTTIMIGLGSGLGYALYSIFSKFALKKYETLTITTYTFLISAISLLPFFPFQTKGYILFQLDVLPYAIGLGLFPTAIAYIMYTYGLGHIEASKAAILSTIEPVIATLIGILIFLEPFTISQIIGMSCILIAVILIETPITKQQKKRATH